MKRKNRRRGVLLFAVAATLLLPDAGAGQATFREDAVGVTIEPNVVYGMVSGLALLMDVYRPDRPNGRGIIFIPGSGWQAPPHYGAPALKGRPARAVHISLYTGLLDAGYTLFVINHRATPRFHYPDFVNDAQRAVRFIRHRAAEYGVDPDRLGAVGHSSGGHLASMLGTLPGDGDPADEDPVNRESARVQAVVAGAAPTELSELRSGSEVASAALREFFGQEADSALYRAASPLYQVSPDDVPFLLIHATADATVPYRQSELLHAALRDAGVDAELIRIHPGGHGALYRTSLVGPIVTWLSRRLLDPDAAGELEPLIAALDSLAAGRALGAKGDVAGAVAAFERARRRSDRLTVPWGAWNGVCWQGSLQGHAAAALPVCERAVAMAPWSGQVRDSRGLARALTGDFAGAIADFEFFLADTDPRSPARAAREAWIAALREGRNPFTPEVLEALRGT